MENNLLRSVKYRVMDELRGAIQEHQVYRNKIECYHKFPMKERPQGGVVLRGASSTRIKLSPDDCAGTLKSYLALAHAENKEGNFLDWVWEDPTHMSTLNVEEDLSSQIEGTSTFGKNRVFYVQHKPILSGRNNLVPADNFRQIALKLNGEDTFAEFVDGKRGMIILPQAPVLGDTLTVNYYYSNLTPPGRYYIELVSATQFIIDPFYQIKTEEVVVDTTGLETTAQLAHGNIYGDFDTLYTQKTPNSTKFGLERNVDYTITEAGLITFLQPLPVATTLYADYRWVGARMGPFDIPEPFHEHRTALPGVVLCFSNQLNVGGKMVVIVYPQREPAAMLYSGHFNMTFEIEVFSRDPQQLADLTDHVIQYIWAYRRLPLMDEGLTITEMDPTGETEDVYDENTGDLYYKNGVSLQMMTEWKKFVPFLYELLDFDIKLYQYAATKQYIVTNQNQILELRLVPHSAPFEVKFPKTGSARYF